MVLTRENHALHARFDKGLYPLLAVESGGVERGDRGITIAPFLIHKSVGPEVDKRIGLQLLPLYLLRAG